DDVVTIGVDVGPSDRAAQRDHVMREAGKVERLVQGKNSNGAEAGTSLSGRPTAQPVTQRGIELKPVFGRDAERRALVVRVAEGGGQRRKARAAELARGVELGDRDRRVRRVRASLDAEAARNRQSGSNTLAEPGREKIGLTRAAEHLAD